MIRKLGWALILLGVSIGVGYAQDDELGDLLTKCHEALNSKRFDECIDLAETVLGRDADNKSAFLYRGIARNRTRAYLDSYSDLIEAVNQGVDNEDVWMNLASDAVALKRHKLALEYLDKGEAKGEKWSKHNRWAIRAFALAGLERLKEAETAFTELLKVADKAHREIHRQRLAIRWKLKLWNGAIDDLNWLIDNISENSAYRLQRARAQLKMSRIDKAEDDYRALLEADPESPDAQFGVYRVRTLRGEHEGAFKEYDRLRTEFPEWENLWELERHYFELTLNDASEQLEQFRVYAEYGQWKRIADRIAHAKSLVEGEEWPDAWRVYAQARLGALDEAESEAREMIEREVFPTFSNLILAYVHRERGAYGAALEFARKAVEKDAKRADANAELAVSLRLAGRADEAIALIDRVLPESGMYAASLILEKAHCFHAIGRPDEAIALTDAVLKDYPKYEGTAECLKQWIVDGGPTTREDWVIEARRLFGEGKIAAAAEQMKRATTALEVKGEELWFYADLLVMLDRFDEALPIYLAVYNNDKFARQGEIGPIYVAVKERRLDQFKHLLKDAKTARRRAALYSWKIYVSEDPLSARFSRLHALNELGAYDLALDDCRELEKQGYDQGFVDAGRVRTYAAAGRLGMAVALQQERIDADPTNLNRHLELARMHADVGDMDKCVEAWEAGLAAIPDSTDLISKLTEYFEESGNLDRQLQMVEHHVARGMYRVDTLLKRGQLRERTGDAEGAKEDYQAVLDWLGGEDDDGLCDTARKRLQALNSRE